MISRGDEFAAETRPAAIPEPAGDAINRLRIAIVHYWLTSYGGGEKVLEAFAEIFPRADFYALAASPDGVPPGVRGRPLTTSLLGRAPGIKRWYRHLFPFYPFVLEQFDLDGYDLVISSESGPAKGVITSPQTCHLCYCLTPMRYLWDKYHEYRKAMNPAGRAVFSLAAHYARMWDVTTAARVDYFAADSEHVAARIRKYYRRESTVIYPPVDTAAARLAARAEDYYLVVSRLVPYKRVDLAIAACNRLGRRLRVVGAGPEYKRLRRLAGPTIEFLGKLGTSPLHEIYARCRALLFPAEEDFGIVPVEAQSFGRPVIAYGRGGALETVIGLHPGAAAETATGIFFHEQTAEALSHAIAAFEKSESSFCPSFVRAHAQRFSKERFRDEFTRFTAGHLAKFRASAAKWPEETGVNDFASPVGTGAGQFQ